MKIFTQKIQLLNYLKIWYNTPIKKGRQIGVDEMKRELLSKTNDKVFKEIFTRNKSCMADFLKCILNIPDEEF